MKPFSKKSDLSDQTPSTPPQDPGSQEITKYHPAYEFLVKLVKLITAEGVPPQEIKALAEAYPFVTVDDVGDLTAKIWTLATEKYKIPREWLLRKLPKNASLKKADLKEYSNEATKAVNDYIVANGNALHNMLMYVKRSNSQEELEQTLSGGQTYFSTVVHLLNLDPSEIRWDELAYAYYTSVKGGEDEKRRFQGQEPLVEVDIQNLPTLNKKQKLDDLLDSLSAETDPAKKEQIKKHIERIKRAKLLKADLWPSQEETEDMLDHAPGYLAYEYGQDKTSKAKKLNISKIVEILNAKEPKVIRIDTSKSSLELADGTSISFDDAAKKAMEMDKTADVFQGSEFSKTDNTVNPLMDIGPWSSPEDQGAKPQKGSFPSLSWQPSGQEDGDAQPYSNIAASLRKIAIQQQDVVDFYLLSLLPQEYLTKEVSPEHYDALATFKTIIMSLRDEYIRRGMEELKDEAETTAWTKAIPDSDMPEQIKKYYKYHDEPFKGHYSPDDDDENSEPEYDYTCESCNGGIDGDDVFSFNESVYCPDCYMQVVEQSIREDVAYCVTHNVFLTDNSDLKSELMVSNKNMKDPEEHPEGPDHQWLRYNQGHKVFKEIEENAKKQLELQFEERKERKTLADHAVTPEDFKTVCTTCGQKGEFHTVSGDCPGDKGTLFTPAPKQLKFPTASLKKQASNGWWEAPRNFNDYTSEDYYTIFEYAPWKHMYGGPAWAEIAKTINEMQKTTAWDKLVLLIDHFHDLGHNTGKLLDKFPEWHEWFKKLLDMKAQKNSIRYLLPKASRAVKDLVTEYLNVHGKTWREDEEESKSKNKDGWAIGDEVLVEHAAGSKEKYTPAKIVQFVDNDLYSKPYEVRHGNVEEWVSAESLKSPQFAASSLNRPFSKKASLDGRYWIAPDGTEFDAGTHHGAWVMQHKDILEKYGINVSKNLYDIGAQMYATGWTRVTPERGFTIQVADLNHVPAYLDDFIAKHFTRRDTIRIGTDFQMVEITDPFPSIQKAIKKQLIHNKASLNKRAASIEEIEGTKIYINPSWEQAMALLERAKYVELRGIVEPATGTLFIWDSNRLTHENVIRALAIDVDPYAEDEQSDYLSVMGEESGLRYMFEKQQELRNQLAKSKKKADLGGNIVNEILQDIEFSGGATYNLSKGNLAGTSNYSVSIFPERSKIIPGVADFDTIEGYIVDNEDLLANPDNSFGAWSHEGKTYLDVVATIPDREQATQLGRKHNQIAIWDLKNSKEIPTGGTGEVRASSKKAAADQILTQEQQNEIAAASSPAYVIAVNNYAEAVKRGHSKDRSLAYAIESIRNLEKIDAKKLVELINKYVIDL